MDIGGGGNSFPFDKIGDSVTGKIVSMEEVQQTDMETGEPAFWNNNPAQPKMMYAVTLQTELRDEDSDDGQRTVYLKGSRKPESKSSLAAVVSAVRSATGGTSMDTGAELTLTFTGEGKPSKRGWNPPKHYEASYKAPSVDLI